MQNSAPSDEPVPAVAGPSAPNHHAMSSSAIPRAPSDDSWIEVSSRPSSSSLSSAADEIITTGLRVQQDPRARRRRRMRQTLAHDLHLRAGAASAGGSSQEEYEESESESDRAMSSSNEAVQPSPLREEWRPSGLAHSTVSSENADVSGEDYEEGEDENATAVGIASSEARFVPQPNAFSRPAQGRQQTSSLPHYGSSQRPRRPSQRHSYPAQEQHSPFNVISTSHQADHDAALRASLSTLLSCAAAARSLPKSTRANTQTSQPTASNRIDPTSLRMVPDYIALGGAAPPPTSTPATAGTQDAMSDKGKRKAISSTAAGISQPRSSSRDRRVAKKARRTPATGTSMEDVSPTLLTWVVGAGVLVLVSAISFSAGYAVGREAGHTEAAAGMSEVGAGIRGCGNNLAAKGSGLGLRRWTGAAAGVRA